MLKSPTSGTRDISGRVEVRQLVGGGKDKIIGEGKTMHTNKAKPGMNSLLPTGRHFQESKAQSFITET